MDQYGSSIRLDVELQEADRNMGVISYFDCAAEGPFEIVLPTDSDPFALIINLGLASDLYFLNGMECLLPFSHFNIFYIAGDSFRWQFKEGPNSFVVLKVTEQLLRSLCEETCLKPFLEHSGSTHSHKLNKSPLQLTPVMERDLVELLSNSAPNGLLHSMRRQSASVSLLINAVEVSQQYDQQILNEENTNEVLRVCNYFIEHISKIHNEADLIKLSSLPNVEFKRVFDLLYHWPLSYFMNSERLKVAERLVRFSSLSFYSIAKQTGFQTKAELIFSFEERYGMGPEEFRESYGI